MPRTRHLLTALLLCSPLASAAQDDGLEIDFDDPATIADWDRRVEAHWDSDPW